MKSVHLIFVLIAVVLKDSSWTSSVSWDPVRHADYQAPPQVYWIRNSDVGPSSLLLRSLPRHSDARSSLSTTVLGNGTQWQFSAGERHIFCVSERSQV